MSFQKVLHVFFIGGFLLIALVLIFGHRETPYSLERSQLRSEYFQAKINSSYALKYSSFSKLLPKVLFNEKSRYVMRYPDNWEYGLANGMVVLKGKEGTPAFYINVNIQTISAQQFGGQFGDTNQILNNLKNQFASDYSNVRYLESGSINLTELDGTTVMGKYVVFTFSLHGLAFKQWQVVFPRSDGRAFYTWAFTTPLMQYQDNLATAQQMLKTLNIF